MPFRSAQLHVWDASKVKVNHKKIEKFLWKLAKFTRLLDILAKYQFKTVFKLWIQMKWKVNL